MTADDHGARKKDKRETEVTVLPTDKQCRLSYSSVRPSFENLPDSRSPNYRGVPAGLQQARHLWQTFQEERRHSRLWLSIPNAASNAASRVTRHFKYRLTTPAHTPSHTYAYPHIHPIPSLPPIRCQVTTRHIRQR
jgi:hypothetical protein